jgi:hypothetical protein
LIQQRLQQSRVKIKMKLNKQILREMVEEELNECGCGMMPPAPDQGPPEGSDEAEMANQIADLVADIVYNVLMPPPQDENDRHDCEAEHPGESHEFWEVMKMFKKAGLDPVLNEISK